MIFNLKCFLKAQEYDVFQKALDKSFDGNKIREH